MSEVEVDEVLGFCRLSAKSKAEVIAMPTVSNETAKVSTDDAVPCCALAVVELGGSVCSFETHGNDHLLPS